MLCTLLGIVLYMKIYKDSNLIIQCFLTHTVIVLIIGTHYCILIFNCCLDIHVLLYFW